MTEHFVWDALMDDRLPVATPAQAARMDVAIAEHKARQAAACARLRKAIAEHEAGLARAVVHTRHIERLRLHGATNWPYA